MKFKNIFKKKPKLTLRPFPTERMRQPYIDPMTGKKFDPMTINITDPLTGEVHEINAQEDRKGKPVGNTKPSPDNVRSSKMKEKKREPKPIKNCVSLFDCIRYLKSGKIVLDIDDNCFYFLKEKESTIKLMSFKGEIKKSAANVDIKISWDDISKNKIRLYDSFYSYIKDEHKDYPMEAFDGLSNKKITFSAVDFLNKHGDVSGLTLFSISGIKYLVEEATERKNFIFLKLNSRTLSEWERKHFLIYDSFEIAEHKLKELSK